MLTYVIIGAQVSSMPETLAEEYISVVDAARLLSVHAATIRRWIDAGMLPSYRLGRRRVLVKRTDLNALVAPARPAIPRLSPAEQEQARTAMHEARQVAAEIRARRGGQLFSSSDVLLDEVRDQRVRDLT